MPTTALENELRAQARALVGQGQLPNLSTAKIWGGYGRNDPSLCGKPIVKGDVQYEIELPQDEYRYVFHFMCHAAWQLECVRSQALKQQK